MLSSFVGPCLHCIISYSFILFLSSPPLITSCHLIFCPKVFDLGWVDDRSFIAIKIIYILLFLGLLGSLFVYPLYLKVITNLGLSMQIYLIWFVSCLSCDICFYWFHWLFKHNSSYTVTNLIRWIERSLL